MLQEVVLSKLSTNIKLDIIYNLAEIDLNIALGGTEILQTIKGFSKIKKILEAI